MEQAKGKVKNRKKEAKRVGIEKRKSRNVQRINSSRTERIRYNKVKLI